MIEQGGHKPEWHLVEHTWVHPSSGRMQMEVQDGIGSEQEVRDSNVFGGNEAADEISRRCLPHGQWVTSEEERGQGGGVSEGRWQGFEQ